MIGCLYPPVYRTIFIANPLNVLTPGTSLSPYQFKKYWSDQSSTISGRSMADKLPDDKLPGYLEQGSSNQKIDATLIDQVRLAENQDEKEVLSRVKMLLTGKDQPLNQRWYLCANGKGIRRSFHFRTFNQTWAFMEKVADKCKKERHHPEWWNVCTFY
jgi:hypothetical protein